MIQELKYNGITTVPSDYECPDGDMSGMINAVIEDGVVRPLCPPTEIYAPETKAQVKYIHKVGEKTNYILVGGNRLYWYNGAEEKKIVDIPRIKSINSIGNTLVVIADEGMHYILWKADEQDYKYLGTHIPDLPISFGLQGEIRLFDEDDTSKVVEGIIINKDDYQYKANSNEFTDESKKAITNNILAKVNKHIQQETVDKGRFCFPFFVRYALRLYDGTLVNHSAPILMMPSTSVCPFTTIYNHNIDDTIRCVITLVAADIDYRILPTHNATEIFNKWTDIVKDIVVYISKPIYTYDQNGEIKTDKEDFPETYYLGSIIETERFGKEEVQTGYYALDYRDIIKYVHQFFISQDDDQYAYLSLPLRDKEDVSKDIRDTNTFYLLKEMPLTNIKLLDQNKRTKIEIPKSYLQSLTSREVMTDDYLSNDKLIPKYSFVFNQRLSLANVSRQLYNGFNPCAMFTYIQGDYNWIKPTYIVEYIGDFIEGIPQASQSLMSIQTYIKDSSGNIMVQSDYESSIYPDFIISVFESLLDDSDKRRTKSWGNYLFYPNVNAYKMRIVDNSGKSFVFDLKPHDFLNGSYAYLGFEQEHIPFEGDVDIVSTDKIISDPNKVYTSEINNPFYFPVTGINTIGTGEIRGISSAVKALSQGQFGQFPMYVFASDGVWALETSASGTFTAKQPVTRDVCICPESITQVDGAVLFATDRGIMMLQGSTANCISLDLDKDAQDLTAFPHLIELLDKHDYPIPSVDSNFKEYVKDCRMVYDYVNQRIIVAKPNATYAYVYSMKSNKWGMIESTIVDSINSYPEAYAVGKDGGLLDYSNPTIKDVKATLVTRPIKFDAPNDLKTIRTIVQRGMIERRDVKFILYGSRDLVNWYALASTTTSFLKGISGTPYKYFRLAIMADLKEDKSIYGATIDVEPKYNNRIR